MLLVLVDDGAGQDGHVVGAGVVLRVRQAGGVHEVRVLHAELLGGLVHHVGEGVFTTGDVFGQGDAGVVAGLDDDAVQQVIHGHLAVDRQEHGGTTGRRATGTPGVLADGHQVLLADLALANFQGGDVGGHQLGQAGRRQALIAVVLHQHLAAGAIHQHIGLGSQLRRRGDRRFGGRGERHGQQHEQGEALGKAGDVHPVL